MTLKEHLQKNDRFAANSGCVLEEIGEDYARASLVVTSHHKLPYVDVRITNQDDELCCVVTGIGYRKKATMPVEGLM